MNDHLNISVVCKCLEWASMLKIAATATSYRAYVQKPLQIERNLIGKHLFYIRGHLTRASPDRMAKQAIPRTNTQIDDIHNCVLSLGCPHKIRTHSFVVHVLVETHKHTNASHSLFHCSSPTNRFTMRPIAERPNRIEYTYNTRTRFHYTVNWAIRRIIGIDDAYINTQSVEKVSKRGATSGRSIRAVVRKTPASNSCSTRNPSTGLPCTSGPVRSGIPYRCCRRRRCRRFSRHHC